MFMHNKRLQYTVRVAEPNPKLACMLLEQFGGADGELSAAMRYFTQGLSEEDPGRKDLLLDVATEELSHLEIIGSIVAMLNKGAKAQLSEQAASEAELYQMIGSSGTSTKESILFGGADGELSAAMRYFTQGLSEEDPGRKDLLLDVATEELSHLEIIGSIVAMLNKGAKAQLSEQAASEAELYQMIGSSGTSTKESILFGGGAALMDSAGVPWTAAYVDSRSDPTVDLRSNIAAEARAKIVYERLIGITDDPGIKEALGFLMTREIAHQKSFEKALYSIEDNFPPGKLPGVEKYASMYVNASQGEGDMTGAWNSGEQWDTVDDLSEVLPADEGGDGTASVNLSAGESAALKAMMFRLKSDPGTDALTGADLGAGPGAGRTTGGDMGGAADIQVAPAKANAAELAK